MGAQKAYWQSVARRAAAETAEVLGVRRWAPFIAATLVACITFVLVGLTKEWDWQSTFFAFLAPFVVYPLWFVFEFVKTPAKLAKEERERAETIEREAQSKLDRVLHIEFSKEMAERKKHIEKIIALYASSRTYLTHEMMAGLELPPEDWINAQLKSRNIAWRFVPAGHGQWTYSDLVGSS